VIRKVFQQVAQRPDSFCNYLEGSIPEWGEKTKIIYRHYATLYFIFAVDQQESDLGILDLIQVRTICTTIYYYILPYTTMYYYIL
jgi:AP-3 complex subunit sigma